MAMKVQNKGPSKHRNFLLIHLIEGMKKDNLTLTLSKVGNNLAANRQDHLPNFRHVSTLPTRNVFLGIHLRWLAYQRTSSLPNYCLASWTPYLPTRTSRGSKALQSVPACMDKPTSWLRADGLTNRSARRTGKRSSSSWPSREEHDSIKARSGPLALQYLTLLLCNHYLE